MPSAEKRFANFSDSEIAKKQRKLENKNTLKMRRKLQEPLDIISVKLELKTQIFLTIQKMNLITIWLNFGSVLRHSKKGSLFSIKLGNH